MAKKKNSPIKVSVKSDGGEIQKDLHLYLFDKEGELMESVPLNKGEAKLKTPAEDARGKSQVLIGPPIPEEFKERKLSPILIKKMGGYQPSVRITPDNELNIIGLPKFKFPIWDWCLITGSLSKSFTVDGQNQVLPVCDARIHICEIDRIHWWWPLIPIPVITDLADRLKEVIVLPEIDIPPIPDPGPKFPFRRTFKPTIKPKLATPLSLEKTPAMERRPFVALPDHVKRGLLSNSTLTVQDTIFNHFHLLHPYLCLWPRFWPYFYRCTKIATVYSDCNGSFDYNYLNFTNDKDIYIWVEVNIDGEWVSVYRPPIPCHTHWDYECGKEINIRITDPRVRPCSCDPLPGALVWMRSVNYGKTIRSIQQKEIAESHLSNTVGLTYHGSSGDRISPFGGQFPFVVQFGNGFPATGGVTHYRWSYRKLKSAFLDNVSDTSHDLEGEIKKSYRYLASGGTLFATKSFTLGPTYDAGRPKYKIPHVDASADVSEPNADYYHLDTGTINIDSDSLSEIDDGLYEFIFELLDDAGNVVPVSPKTFLLNRIGSDPVDPIDPAANTIAADDIPFENYVVKSGGMAIAFKFKMRIDNQACYADVLDTLVSGNGTDPDCGIGNYINLTDPVILKFLAGHTHDFATYDFDVTKGNSNAVPDASVSGNATVTDPVKYSISQVLDAEGKLRDQYASNSLTVGNMLDGCTIAAFAEVLDVYATHTNGHRRLHEFDASDTAAIAIAPTEPADTP